MEIVKEKHQLRKLLLVCAEITGNVFDNESEVEKLLDAAERNILSIRTNRTAAQPMTQLCNQAVDMIEWKSQNWHKISGLSTGLIDLDRHTDGLHNGEFIVLSAYPSTGKTALMVNMAVHNALLGIPVAVLSAEMRPLQLIVRTLCSEASVNFRKISENDLPKLVSAVSSVSKSPFYCEAVNGFSIGQIEALVRRLVQKHGIKMVAVDYLQLLTGEGDNESQKLTSVSQGLKRISLEHNIPVLVGSQLNDDGKILGSRTPAQDGDSVWKLQNDGDWQPEVQPIKINIEKCRDGETGCVKAIFFKTITRFRDVARVKD